MVPSDNYLGLRTGLEAGGGLAIWERAVREALPAIKKLVPAGSRVLELGYGDGLLTCYLCQELGWRIKGLEVSGEAQRLAEGHAKQYGLTEFIKFRYGQPEEILCHCGQYDAVFIKTVLYASSNLTEYARWLDWVLSVLRPGGTFINFETGRANNLTQFYRRLRQRVYTDLCLYTTQVETLYDARFEILERYYYGGLSQFLTPVPALYYLAAHLEEKWRPRNADNSFIVSIIARHPE